MPRVNLKKYKLFAFIVESDIDPVPEDLKFIKLCWKAFFSEKSRLQLNQITDKKLGIKQIEKIFLAYAKEVSEGKIKLNKIQDETIRVNIERIKNQYKKRSIKCQTQTKK